MSAGSNSWGKSDMNKIEQAIRKISGNNDIFLGGEQNSFASVEEIERMQNRFSLSTQDLLRKKIIFPAMKDNDLVNSFRELRTNIIKDADRNIVMVTSTSRSAGNSFFARNLAAATAFDVSKTSILFDCSIADNDAGKLFDIADQPGILNYLLDKEINIEDIIYESGVKRLRIIPFGSCESSIGEHFSHPRFENLVSQLKHKYGDRHIFIDAPPILESADARILMALCDQVVVVVPYGDNNLANIQAATKIIGQDKFSGVVFNDYVQ
jgi:Mrp family chromosome partitioning ATPase